MFNEFVDKEMCKPQWREYGVLIPELSTLLTSMTRVKRIAASDGSLIANQTAVGNEPEGEEIHAKAGHIIKTTMKCFNCLGPHSYRHCKLAKAKCGTCGFAHHTDMHDIVQELNERAAKRAAARPGPSPAEIDAARAVGMRVPAKAYRTDLSSSNWDATVAGYEEYAAFHSDNPPDLDDPQEDGTFSAMMARMAALEVDQAEPVNFRASMARFDRHQFEPSEREWEL
jgi:hypothetical protein